MSRAVAASLSIVLALACAKPGESTAKPRGAAAGACAPVLEGAIMTCEGSSAWPAHPSADEVEGRLLGDDCYDLRGLLEHGEAYALVHGALASEQVMIRERAIHALRYFPGCDGAVEDVRPMLSDPRPVTRVMALGTWVGLRGEAALGELEVASEDEDVGVRSTVIDLLGGLEGRGARRVLAEIAANDPDPQLRAQAASRN